MAKKDNLVIGIVIIVLVFLFVFFGLRTATKTEKEQINKTEIRNYKGFIFEKQENFWLTKIRLQDTVQGWTRDYEIMFHYTPDEVEHIPTMKNARNQSVLPNLFMDARTVYITMDPEYPSSVTLAAVEISKILGKVYEKDVQVATNRPDNRSFAPVITCNDLKAGVRVIELRLYKDAKIFSEHGCIIVQGTDPEELLKAAERLSFEMLKIL